MKFNIDKWIKDVHQKYNGSITTGVVDGYDFYIINSGKLMVLIDKKGYVKAEASSTFNKWSKAYYKNGLPYTNRTGEWVMKHLDLLNQSQHIKGAENYKGFWESYLEEHEQWN